MIMCFFLDNCADQFDSFSLVFKVTTLVNTSNKGPSGKKKGRSKKAHVLAASVEQATQNFLDKGEQIAKESQDLKEELVAAVEDVRKQGRKNNIVQEGYILMCKQWIYLQNQCIFAQRSRLLFSSVSVLVIFNICWTQVHRQIERFLVVAVSKHSYESFMSSVTSRFLSCFLLVDECGLLCHTGALGRAG